MRRDQLNIDFAKKARDEGIDTAVAHADRVVDFWSVDAYEAFKNWLRAKEMGETFLIEDFRADVAQTLEDPPSRRAFGFIPIRAAKEKLIQRVGYTQVKNITAHKANAALWKKM